MRLLRSKNAPIYLDAPDGLARDGSETLDHRSFVMKRSAGNDNANCRLFIHGRRRLDCLLNSIAARHRLFIGTP